MTINTAGSKAFILFIMPLILYAALLPVMPLMEPDEGRYALIPHAMNATADYVTPHLKGVVYLEKPPLGYWGTALAFKIFGENEFSSRLFPGLCAWGCIILAYFMGTYFHKSRTGLYSAAVLTTCLLPFVLGRVNILDMPLTFFLACSIWSGFRYFDADREKKSRSVWLYLMYLCSALAFLTKGLIGIVFPFAIIGLWLLSLFRFRDVLGLISPIGIMVFAVVAGPWIYLVQKANPDFLYFFFIQEHFLRYTTAMHERTEPAYYYLLILLGGTLPWWPYLPKSLFGIRKGAKLLAERVLFRREEILFYTIWVGVILVFFTLSSSKLASYIAPVFIPLAILMGHVFSSYEARSLKNQYAGIMERILSNMPIVLQSLLFALVVFVPYFIPEYEKMGHPSKLWVAGPIIVQALILLVPLFMKGRVASGWFFSVYFLSAVYLALILFPVSHYLTPGKSSLDIVRAMKTNLPKGEVLYQYKITMYGIDFYSGMRTPIVDDMGELKYGAEHLPEKERRRYFPTAAEFTKDIREGKERYCITEGMGHVEGLKTQVRNVRILWDNNKFYLLHLKG
ncbi:MAG: Undecaprenyl phosphate-alpha-4-amino-4-deoxy-L-arabinose arabinosyl transferase [Syntrophus sp. SKADARSKE-3]|nr:Undecaprenyl phosphate-alpha-4-amino-4-deoxy-L-arabinose arabinosyl transferase [Syntrophus sp. SKADARSKE-3]